MNFKSLFSIFEDTIVYKFAVVGFIGSIIALSLSGILTSIFEIYYAISVLISLEISLLIGFFIHERWTFVGVNKITESWTRLIKYNFFSLIGFGLNEAILISLTNMTSLHYLMSEGVAIIITFVFNFIISKKITWKH